MATPRALTAFSILALLVAACAGPGAGDPEAPAPESGSRNVIVQDDLAAYSDLSAFEIVRRLRPAWLRYRGQSVLSGPEREGLRVYLDGSFYGDADALGQLQARNLEEIRFLDSRQATLRFGTGHTVGAILVTTRR